MRLVLVMAASLLLLSAACSVPQAETGNPAPLNPTTSTPIPSNINKYLEQGIAYSQSGQPREAIDSLTLFIEQGGKSAVAYYYRGAAYYELKQFDAALIDLTKAVEINSNYTDAYFERSRVYAFKGNWEKALSDSTKVLQLNPQAITAYYTRALAGIKLKKYDGAIKDLETFGYIDPGTDAWADLKDITALVVPLDELVLMKIDLTSKQTGVCVGGACSAPIGYNITLRAFIFANPGETGIQVMGANTSPALGWMSEIPLKGSIHKPGLETMAANIAAAQELSNSVSCTVTYKSTTGSPAKDSNSVSN